MRDYGKVYSTFWSSQTTHSLSDDGKLLALYLMTCSHNTIAGVFRLPDGYVAEDIGWDNARVQQGFAELFRKGFANRCETTKWVWVVKHLEWNKPENPNQRKSAAKIAMSIPVECGWRLDFMRVCGEALALKCADESNPSETVAKGLLNQEQEQEQEQDKEEAKASLSSAEAADVASPTGACPHAELINIFSECLPMLPQPKPELWSGARASALRARWRWVMTAKKRDGSRYASSREEALNWFRRFFAYAAQSDFLTGRDGKWTGCDLGWLCNESNFAKVLQGNYDNREVA